MVSAQSVLTQLLPLLGATLVQLAVFVGPVVTGVQATVLCSGVPSSDESVQSTGSTGVGPETGFKTVWQLTRSLLPLAPGVQLAVFAHGLTGVVLHAIVAVPTV